MDEADAILEKLQRTCHSCSICVDFDDFVNKMNYYVEPKNTYIFWCDMRCECCPFILERTLLVERMIAIGKVDRSEITMS